MAETIKLPDLGEGIESADVVNVLVSPGDEVTEDQGIIEIETDKASVEVPAPRAGTIASIDVEEGQTLNVGDPIGTYEEGEGGDKKAKKPEAASEEKTEEPEGKAEKSEAEEKEEAEEDKSTTAETAEKPEIQEEKPEAPEGRPGRPDELIPAGPSMRRMARDLGVDLRNVEGSGPGGRIEREDLLEYVRKKTSGGVEAEPTEKAPTQAETASAGEADSDQHGPVRREKLTKIRRTIAEKMADSFQTIPHVTHFDEADVTAMNEFRKEHKEDFEKKDLKLTLLPFVVRAVASALQQHPTVNARIDMDAGEIVYKDYVSVGIAVDTDRGLVVPVLRNVDRLSIAQIAEGIQDLAASAREGDFEISDLRGGTFTVSNVGAVGGWYVTPIINKPEAAILLVGRSKMKPVVYDGEITQRLIMPLSLSYDHRLIDGATAARFMNEIINLLECPGRLLLTI
jgi:2-oxoglutarate dehydrogenase complex dihydrolipoamide succinyltransferase (E2) component